ncbi:MAG: FAD assembly factor SdhE [Gammaproteobacteria bacterium]
MASLEKLRWRCRRGTKELDWLLIGYLDNGYGQADDEEKRQFDELLEREDDELQSVLLGEPEPKNEGMRRLLEKIRASAEFRSQEGIGFSE